MDTAAGKAAKRYAEALFANSLQVTIYTTKPDKYDRYLADVFLSGTKKSGDEERVFLNNALLRDGHATRKDEYSLADWET
jgi:endonuclease YncB( thermonuclease family)